MLRVLLVVAFVVLAGTAWADKRVALVVGEDDYRTIRRLDNAVADAQSVEATLEKLGFAVTLETNRDLRRLRRALDDFREDGSDADVALVYFAGHGVEIAGDNRLLPTDADASSLEALKASTLPLEEVREAVASISRVGLIMLDACRNDPFGTARATAAPAAESGNAGGTAGTGGSAGGDQASGRGVVAIAPDKDVKPGLGRIGRAEGILFAFSAAPGETASDGDGGHSPFAAALVKYLGTDGLEVRSVLTLVQQEVYDRTRGRQLPYVENGLPRMFFAAVAMQSLPERERLLLAMANVTPDLRAEVERIAAASDMPLAPLYGALISSDAGSLSDGERVAKLQEAAAAFVKVRQEMATLASDDPQVARLRSEAEEQLSLGAFDAAQARLAAAADIDSTSRQKLKENYLQRTLSEAATRYISGGAASANLDYAQAIAEYTKAASLFDEVDAEDIPPEDRFRQTLVLASLGNTYLTVGDLASAGRAFEDRHRVAEREAGRRPDDPLWQRELAISNSKRGDVQVAQGDLDSALVSYEAARALSQKLAEARPGDIDLNRDLSVVYTGLAYVLRTQGNFDEALNYYTAALGISKVLSDAIPDDINLLRDVGVDYDNVGDVRMMKGNLEEARTAYSAGHAIWLRVTEAAPGNAEWQRDLMISDTKIGDVQRQQGDPEGALASYREALAISRRLVLADPGNTDRQRDVAIGNDNIGDAYMSLSRYSEALDAYSAGNELWRKLVDADSLNTRWQRDLVVSYSKIGDIKLSLGDAAGALEAYEAGLANGRHLTEVDPTNTLWQRDLFISLQNVGDVRLLFGNVPGALKSYDEAMGILEHLAALDHGNGTFQRDLILLNYRMARAGSDPEAHLQKALDIALDMQARGILAPTDSAFPDLLREELARVQGGAK
jgi:uncharacterized caspase-like protein/predicted negative regulator of RcsB-dependent stress response